MILKRKIFFLFFIFLIFTTYSPQYNKLYSSYFFPIKEIIIENNSIVDPQELLASLDYLKNSSLFFLNKNKLLDVTKENHFISNIYLKKIYPNALKIKVFEKNIVAIQIYQNNKFYITDNNDQISYKEIDLLKNKNLPIIFGNHQKFKLFFEELRKNNFKLDEIKSFYYFDVGRWDIMLNDERLIKLPEKDYQYVLSDMNLILTDKKFSKYKVFDYRVKDQLILK